jgi:hypothetical protein
MTAALKKMPTDNRPLMFLGTVLVVMLLMSINSAAQTKVTSALIKPDSLETQIILKDSLGLWSGTVDLVSDVHSKSGSLAMLLSAILPGAGQVYAHRYYTIPIFYGFGIYFSSIAIKANNQYMDYRGKFSESVRLDTIAHTGDPNLLNARDFYRDQRDQFILYLGLTYFLNIIDAYVGATLYDFDVSDNLGGSAKLQVRIPLH